MNNAHPMRKEEWQGFGEVLLIDDDKAVRDVLARMLERLGFQVTAKASGAEGLACFRAAVRRYSLVALDWVMPDMGGGEVLRALRELAPSVPVVLVSGYGAHNLATNDRNVIRLQKPMTLSELQEAIQQLLARSARISP
jgi:two-component system cell cycle sensor histidine kinase/response regulator CckA